MKTTTQWIARIIAAALMLQTLYYKFTGASESVELFEQLGAEPEGRIGTGVFELIASVLILIPATVWLGALLAVGLMSGAILSHVFVIGITRNDGGQLFWYAVIVLVCSLYSFWVNRKQTPTSVRKFFPLFLQ
ncbi:MAG: DoxX family protein [Bacteroidetes bacterium]|nr:DoxX family protein [Bacteroidota bacterium]